MKTTKSYLVGLALILVLMGSHRTSAQLADFYSSAGFTNMISNMQNNQMWNSTLERYYPDQYKGKGKTQASGSSNSRAASPGRQPNYNEVPAYRRYPDVQFKSTGTRLTLQEYLDSVAVGAKDKAELKELVLAIFEQYEAEAVRKGYPNDWALAFASYVALNSRIYNGVTEKMTIPFEQNVGLRDVVAEYATDHGIFKNVTNRKKQELYELLIILGGLTNHLYEKAVKEKNNEDIKALKLQSANNLKIVGIKP